MGEKQLTTEETLAEELQRRFHKIHPSEARYIVGLLIDLIAERSEDKAEEAVDKHERDYDHDNWGYGGT
ncbi:hypothetical protein LCGC14_2429460 [marine sediment metagenome]|uniref:Uncharacterized protein n=1 Tax=marine sediment metagenome TaxID=412755 RepID=A0A0F9BME8_9ZZZZ